MSFEQPSPEQIGAQSEEQSLTPEQREAERAKFESAFIPVLRKAVVETYEDENYARSHHLNPIDFERKGIEAAKDVTLEVKYNDDGTVNDTNYRLGGYTPERNKTWNAFMKAQSESGSDEGAKTFKREMLLKEKEQNEQSRQYAKEQVRDLEKRYDAVARDPENPNILRSSEEGNKLLRAINEWKEKLEMHRNRNGGLSTELSRLELSR
ncbi:MAG: hypothetical protein G01um101430_115 [Parcubacteria group bacterium Gr01-1014_30]|nr:MAG: hypothetical protein G01um101430_115 [Parcubacteria group bacterium Gr01-1014_30]